MGTLLVALIAAGVGAAVVWWLTVGPATKGQHAPHQQRSREEAAAMPGPLWDQPYDSLFLLAPSVADKRPSAGLSAIRIIVAVIFVALVGAGTIWVLGVFLNLQIARILGS